MKNSFRNFIVKYTFLVSSILTTILFLSGCGEKVPTPLDAKKIKQIQFNFVDIDSRKNKIGGDITLSIPKSLLSSVLKNTTHYVLYWSSTPSESGKSLQIGEPILVNKKETDFTLTTFPQNTDIQEKYIVLYLKNSEFEDGVNEVYSGLSLAINDVFTGSDDLPKSITKQTPDIISSDKIELGIENVLFEFDSSDIQPRFKEELRKTVESLEDKTKIKFLITGHADERGSNEYNFHLGSRRALSVKRYLISLGIPFMNIETTSKGEEEPLDPRSNEEAWSKNRRAVSETYE